jgi:uncharacterized membrane protein
VIRIGAVYALAGGVFGLIALASLTARDNPKRWNNAVFWGLLAVSFLFGDRLGDALNGVLVLGLVIVGGVFGLGQDRPSAVAWTMGARDLGAKVFLPILVIPVVTLAGTLLFPLMKPGGAPLIDPKQVTVISLGLGVVLAMGLALALVRPPPAAPMHAARRLLDGVGWAAILPQLLAALGAVFALAGVGRAVQAVLGEVTSLDNRVAVTLAYGLGMTAFTLIMGNAFAAFPVMVSALGAPILIGRFGANPALVGAVGMLSGYCGTLMTPMAAHNIVPTALLGLPGGSVIRVQAPTAILVLVFNLALMVTLAFPG